MRLDQMTQMWSVGRIARAAAALAALLICAGGLASEATAASAPIWNVYQRVAPSNLAPGGRGRIIATVENVSAVASTVDATMTVELPPGLTASSAGGIFWDCPGAAGASTFSCTLQTGLLLVPRAASQRDDSPLGGRCRRRACRRRGRCERHGVFRWRRISSIAGRRLRSDSATSQRRSVSSSSSARPSTRMGTPGRQAGGHPDVSTTIEFPTGADGGLIASAKSVFVRLPRGLIGDPTAVPTCAAVDVTPVQGPACAPRDAGWRCRRHDV